MALLKIMLAGGGERAQYLLHAFNDNTIRFVLNYPGLVDADILRTAVKAVVESVDVLHGTFFSDGTMAYWHINENVEESHYFHYVQTAGNPCVTANTLSLLPVYPEDKAQLHVTLVQSDVSSSLVVRISHLCVDGGDGKYLLAKLVEAYNMLLETGSADGFEVKNGSRNPEQVYEKLGLKDIHALMSNPLSSEKTEYPYPSQECGRVRLVQRIIPAETMSAARRKAKAVGATANDLLITACYHAYASLPGVDPSAAMSVSSMMDLRRHCKDGDSEGLCNMSGALPTTLHSGIGETFADTLAEIARQTRAVKENPLAGLEGMPIMHSATRTLPIWILLKVIGKVYGSLCLGLTNLGNLSCQAHALGGLVPNGGMFGGPLKKKPGMQVSIISFDGTCVLSVVGQYTQEDAGMLQGTLDAMAKQIEAYAAE